LPVVLCAYGTWSFTLREECRLRVFENRVLRRIFGPMRDKVTREWRKLHTEELNDLFSSPSILWVMDEMDEHVASMGESRGAYRILVGKPEGERPLGRPGLNGRIILKWIFRNWDVGAWTGSIWLKIGTGGGHFNCGNEPSGSIKYREFLD